MQASSPLLAPAGAAPSPLREGVRLALGAVWLLVFFACLYNFNSVRQLERGAFLWLALAGGLTCLAFERERTLQLLREHRLLALSAAALVLAIYGADRLLGLVKPERFRSPLPFQVGLFLCVVPLAVFVSHRRLLQGVAASFVAVTLFHFYALPMEAVTGVTRMPGEPLFSRAMGPLNYQARGMAWQVYYFPGLFLGLFYFAAGAIGEERAFGRFTLGWRSWLVAGLAWALVVACLQSRSAFAGALAATLVGLLAFAHVRRAGMLLLAALVAITGAALFVYLFSENKSSGGLRFAYMLLYLRKSFDAEWLWTGRGYTLVPDETMQVPGLQYLLHSHNDIIQVAFTWGLPVLLVYLMFWFALVRLAFRFWREGRFWPVLALVAVGPNLLTDLGLHNVEKAGFIAVLAGLAMGLWRPASHHGGVGSLSPPERGRQHRP